MEINPFSLCTLLLLGVGEVTHTDAGLRVTRERLIGLGLRDVNAVDHRRWIFFFLKCGCAACGRKIHTVILK